MAVLAIWRSIQIAKNFSEVNKAVRFWAGSNSQVVWKEYRTANQNLQNGRMGRIDRNYAGKIGGVEAAGISSLLKSMIETSEEV